MGGKVWARDGVVRMAEIMSAAVSAPMLGRAGFVQWHG